MSSLWKSTVQWFERLPTPPSLAGEHESVELSEFGAMATSDPEEGARLRPASPRPITIQPSDENYTSQFTWTPGQRPLPAGLIQSELVFPVRGTGPELGRSDGNGWDAFTTRDTRDVATEPMSDSSGMSVTIHNDQKPAVSHSSSDPTVIIHTDSELSETFDAKPKALKAQAMPIYHDMGTYEKNAQVQSPNDYGGARPKLSFPARTQHEDSDTDDNDDALRRERRQAYMTERMNEQRTASAMTGTQGWGVDDSTRGFSQPEMIPHLAPQAESTRNAATDPLYVNEDVARRHLRQSQRLGSVMADSRTDVQPRQQMRMRQQNFETLTHLDAPLRETRPPQNEPTSTYASEPRRTMNVPQGRDSWARAAEGPFRHFQNRNGQEHYYSDRNYPAQIRRASQTAQVRQDTPRPPRIHRAPRMGCSDRYNTDYTMSPDYAVRYQQRIMSPVLEFRATEEPVFHQRHYAREMPPRPVRGTFDPVTGIFYEELSEAVGDFGPQHYSNQRDNRHPYMTMHPGAHETQYRPYHSTPRRQRDPSPGRTVTFAESRQNLEQDMDVSMHAMHGSYDSGYLADGSSNHGYSPYRVMSQQTDTYPHSNSRADMHDNYPPEAYGLQGPHDGYQHDQNELMHEQYPGMYDPYASQRGYYASTPGAGMPAYDPYVPLQNDSPPQCWPCWPGSNPYRRRLKEGMKFNGKGCPKNFLLQFEILANYNNWSRAERAFELATSLNDDARDVLADLDPRSVGDYEKLRLAILNRFAPPGQSAKFAVLLWSRTMQPNETVTAFGHDLRRLAREAYSAKVDEAVLVGLFIRGLQSVGMQRQVHLSQPRNLNEAMTVAANYSVFDGTANPDKKKPKPYVSNVQAGGDNQNKTPYKQGNQQGKNNNSSDQKLQALENRLDQLEQQKGGKQDKPKKKRDYSTYTCHRCGEKGHIQYNCPSARQDDQPDPSLNC